MSAKSSRFPRLSSLWEIDSQGEEPERAAAATETRAQVTGASNGDSIFETIADPENRLLEAREDNNCISSSPRTGLQEAGRRLKSPPAR